MRIRKYYPSEQSEKAKALMLEHDNWTLSDIGRALGVGRERARQLLIAEGISIRKYRESKNENKRVCPSCGGIKSLESKVCSNCYRKQHNMNFICEVCGDEFSRYKSQVIRSDSKPRFCSRECQGVWLGKNYGFKGEKLGTMGQKQGHESNESYKRPVEVGAMD